MLNDGGYFHPSTCVDENMKYLFQRLSSDIVSVLKDMQMDKTEYACLKCIQLFDPEAKRLKNVEQVAAVRDAHCIILSKYCNQRMNALGDDVTRCAKLIMRLPAFRSWSLKGADNLAFIKVANKFDNLLVEMFVKHENNLTPLQDL